MEPIAQIQVAAHVLTTVGSTKYSLLIQIQAAPHTSATMAWEQHQLGEALRQ
jgi:hypothetical protein